MHGPQHRLSGRVFVRAGTGRALSGLALLLQVESIATGPLDTARGVFGATLWMALVTGVAAARARDRPRHRAWMIRACAIGIGTGLLTIAMGEWIVRKRASARPRQPAGAASPG